MIFQGLVATFVTTCVLLNISRQYFLQHLQFKWSKDMTNISVLKYIDYLSYIFPVLLFLNILGV